MRANLAQLMAVMVIGLLAVTACGSSSGENACSADPTPTMSEEDLDKKC